ncbi:hypothetical protein [Streptomyces sp. AC627_RSS907]|uniref:hypothetical protein n=1 Tax=Streptomyces sp. AC627_RSS907 TaxID=2823684 RepID=UPI001C24BE17|nr:hypothetical protein [Streptomyces sp. AC627_RSS907]
MDQEPWRRARRHEDFRERGLDVGRGELLLATFAALAMHATVADALAAGSPAGTETLHATPLPVVAQALIGKQDYEFLAGTPNRSSGEAVDEAVATIRLLAWQTGSASRWFFYLRGQLHHALITLIHRSPTPSPTCGDLQRWASRAGLLPCERAPGGPHDARRPAG